MIFRRLLRAILPVPVALFVRRHWLARNVAAGTGSQERDVELLPQLVSSADVCWDIGANSGMYTIPLSRLCSSVYAFEPVPHNLDILRLATRLARTGNVVIRDLAISDTNGPARMTVPAEGFYGGFYLAGLDEAGNVPVTAATIDALIEGGLPAPDFIKCDVEGAEQRVIRGARALIAARHPIWLLETFEERVLPLMASLGYTAHVYTEDSRLVAVTQRTQARNYIFLPTSDIRQNGRPLRS
jgi:FkbM family methyltransferase